MSPSLLPCSTKEPSHVSSKVVVLFRLAQLASAVLDRQPKRLVPLLLPLRQDQSYDGPTFSMNLNSEREPVMKCKSETSAVIATFANQRHAAHFVDELKRAGFQDDEIEVYYPQGGDEAGVMEQNARRREREFLKGRTLVVVQALGRSGEVVAVLRRCEKVRLRHCAPRWRDRQDLSRQIPERGFDVGTFSA